MVLGSPLVALALGGEVFDQTSSIVGRDGAYVVNFGDYLNGHNHLLFSASMGGLP